MRKFLISLLAAAACACTVAAIGCRPAETKCTVTFDANGGLINGQATQQVEVTAGEKVQSVGEAEWEGGVFEYWALGGAQYLFDTPVNSDITLTAVYDSSACTFTFEEGEGVKVVSQTASGASVAYGTTVEFTVEVGAFYEGEPVVRANGSTVTPSDDGVYSVTVKENVNVAVGGVVPSVSAMAGVGTVGEPYTITKAADLIFIAERVNAADSNYTTAYYAMANDVDLKGEELEIIGNGVQDGAIFSGYFNGNGCTISNFVINAEGMEYVGLFGIVSADPSNSSLGTIYGLTLSDYVITAGSTGSVLFCGSFVGYGIGANVLVCSAVNGEINVYADRNYFSYVGGVVGIQQSAYAEEYDMRFISSVVYVNASVEINANDGSVLCAGGITGYMYSVESMTISYITNCYAESTVTGAIRSGGVVGCLGRFSSVTNCYASGDVNAQTSMTDGEYAYAYGGGLVGYAENDTSVTDSFATGEVSAVAMNGRYEVTGDIVGGKDGKGTSEAGSEEVVVFNCYYALGGKNTAAGIDLTSAEFIKQNLRWQDYDWVFGDGYPQINYAEQDNVIFRITLSYGGKKVDGKEATVIGINEVYVPFCYWILNGDAQEFVEAESGERSYGYFFDSECTLKVPNSFVATKDITLYAGFADYAEVAGTYYMFTDTNGEVALRLYSDGTFEYADGANTVESTYVYNGEYIILQSIRLGRFKKAALTETGVDFSIFDKIQARADVSDGDLSIYDGTYFTASAPLKAVGNYGISGEYYLKNGGVTEYYIFNYDHMGRYNGGSGFEDFAYTLSNGTLTISLADRTLSGTVTQTSVTVNGSALSSYDEYRGTWVLSATINKSYTFDGMGGWTYKYSGNNRTGNGEYVLDSKSGTYTVNGDGSLSLSDGTKAAFDENGFLVIANNIYGGAYGYKGVWTNAEYGVTLTLNGLNKQGTGTGTLYYEGGNLYEIVYAADTAYEGYITLYQSGDVAGILALDQSSDMAVAQIYIESLSDFVAGAAFYRNDDYAGEWVSESELFAQIAFNGLGSYENGSLTVGEDTVRYILENSTPDGSFVLNGVTYRISYDETTGKATVTGGGNTVVLERKDFFGSLALQDQSGASYSFDGRGNLSVGGTVTVTEADGGKKQYGYKITAGGADLYEGGALAGSITEKDGAYLFAIGSAEKTLLIRTEVTGVWAVSESFDTVNIGLMDTHGNISGTYFGTEVTFRYENSRMLVTEYLGQNVYLFVVDENNIAVSDYSMLIPGAYALCARQDEMFGSWQTEMGHVAEFDGLADSVYVYGNAIITYGGSSTLYQYSRDAKGGILMWNADAIGGRIHNYIVEWCSADTPRAYVCGNRAFRMVEVDSLYLVTATDGSGVTYEFDGLGTVTASDGNVYSYRVTAYNDDSTATVIFTDENGKTYNVTVDYADGGNVKLTFEE